MRIDSSMLPGLRTKRRILRGEEAGPSARATACASVRRRATAAALVGLGLALLGVYVGAGSRLASRGDLLAHPSGIYDMDVARVTADWTGHAAPLRASVHPLQKILVAPVGQALAAALPRGQRTAAQLLAAAASALGAVCAGALAFQLSRGAPGAALAAGALAGVSFASLLAGTLPESAVLAGLTSVLPLVLREARRGRALTAGECAAWGALLVAGFGLTVTQVVVVAIAAGFRGMEVVRLARSGGAGAGSGAWGSVASRALVTAVGAAAVAVSLGALQARVYPGSPRLLAENPLVGERPFLRTAVARAAPARQAGRLALHFALVDFAAPLPAYSPFLLRDYGIRTWSLSAEEAGLDRWDGPRRVLAAAWLAALAVLAWAGHWRDRRLAAPAAVLGFHFALHFVYGREYVLYAPHWHAVLVAVLVAAAWNGRLARGRGRRAALGVVCAGLAAALLAANLGVLASVGDEVAHGLGADVRDARGRALAPAVPP